MDLGVVGVVGVLCVFPSPATIFIPFSLSCWSFSLNFGGVFEDWDVGLAKVGFLLIMLLFLVLQIC